MTRISGIIVRISDYRGERGGRGLTFCNIKLSAKRAAFYFLAMPAGELASRRCLPVVVSYIFAQSRQRFRSLCGTVQ